MCIDKSVVDTITGISIGVIADLVLVLFVGWMVSKWRLRKIQAGIEDSRIE